MVIHVKAMLQTRRCLHDGKRFQPRVVTQRYCSYQCKNAAAQGRLRARAKSNGKAVAKT